MDENSKIRTIEVKQRRGEIVKPAEIIGIAGVEGWTLSDRRTWNLLLQNAWDGEMEDPTRDFEIALMQIRGLHESNDRVKESIRKLQTTLVTVTLPNGGKRTVQMLGATDIFDDDRNEGYMKYDFHTKLVPILRDSSIYTRLDVKIASSFTSKYGLALYEIIASKINLNKSSEVITIDKVRGWLGVEAKKLSTWSNFKKFALEVAVNEVNKLSLYKVEYEIARRQGRKVTHLEIKWGKKKPHSANEQEAAKEVNRHKIGRRARINDGVKTIVDSDPLYLSKSDIQKAYDAAAQICAIDIGMAYDDWRSYARGLPVIPDNPVGHFINYCKLRARKVKA